MELFGKTGKKLAIVAACICLIAILSIALVACSGVGAGFINPGDNLGGGGTVDESNVPINEDTTQQEASINALDTSLSSADTDISIDLESGDVTEVNLSSITEDYKITLAGSYYFSGTTQYRIIIATKDIALHLYFANASIDSIYSDKKPSSTVITLIGENSMSGTYVATNSDSDDLKGVLHIKGDLTINGSGTLEVTAAAKNGIHCTGVLKIVDTTLTVFAENHGIRGNDAVILNGASLQITTTSGDGIQTDNETDSKQVGYIYITDSDITITAGDDGISAATYLLITSGEIDITTNEGAPTNVTETSSDNADGKGLKAGSIEYEIVNADLQSERDKGYVEITYSNGVYTGEITDTSYYAIKIDGGTIKINSNDDAIHSDGALYLNGGTLTIASGDDGIHSESILKITSGTIDITKCYEGIESANIEISGGTISVVSVDDGINAADGTTNAMGQSNSNCYIIISGGSVRVNAAGDGLDSNGTMLISGGEVYIDGPTNSANASLDSDGGILVNGGTLIAVGALGMVETPASNSAQYVISYAASSNIAAGSTLSLKDVQGNTIVSFTTAKACRSVIISATNLTQGGQYTLYSGNSALTSFTISSKITSIGSSATGGGGQSGWGDGWGIRK